MSTDGGPELDVTAFALTGAEASLLRAMRDPSSGVSVKDRRFRLRVYKQCFLGTEAVSWLCAFLRVSREDAVMTGQRLAAAGALYHVTHEHDFEDGKLFFRFAATPSEGLSRKSVVVKRATEGDASPSMRSDSSEESGASSAASASVSDPSYNVAPGGSLGRAGATAAAAAGAAGGSEAGFRGAGAAAASMPPIFAGDVGGSAGELPRPKTEYHTVDLATGVVSAAPRGGGGAGSTPPREPQYGVPQLLRDSSDRTTPESTPGGGTTPASAASAAVAAPPPSDVPNGSGSRGRGLSLFVQGKQERVIGGVTLGSTEQLSALLARMLHPESGIPVADRTYHLKTYKQVFVAETAVSWLLDALALTSRADAVEIFRQMQSLNWVKHAAKGSQKMFTDKHLFYRFINRSPVVRRISELAQSEGDDLLKLTTAAAAVGAEAALEPDLYAASSAAHGSFLAGASGSDAGGGEYAAQSALPSAAGSRRGSIMLPHHEGYGFAGGLSSSGSQSPSSASAARPRARTTDELLGEGYHTWDIPFDDLKLEREIGHGAYGLVLVGTWRSTPVAVKQVRPDQMSEEQAIEFREETQLMMRLRPHKNVVALLGVCTDPMCVIIDFMEKGSLRDVLDKDRVAEQRQVTDPVRLRIMTGVARGLLHMHLEKVVHRDIAARNVLLGADFEPRVTDFGLSRTLDASGVFTSDSNFGPLRWMAPESIKNNLYTRRSDVWMYSLLVVEIFTSVLPYPSLDAGEVAVRVAGGSLLPEKPDNLPDDLALLFGHLSRFAEPERPLFDQVIEQLETFQQRQQQ